MCNIFHILSWKHDAFWSSSWPPYQDNRTYCAAGFSSSLQYLQPLNLSQFWKFPSCQLESQAMPACLTCFSLQVGWGGEPPPTASLLLSHTRWHILTGLEAA